MKLRLQSIQFIRGLAALLVVIYHLCATTQTYFDHKFINITWAWAGVDIFFVLSGFIITYIHFDDIANRRNVFSFIKKRFIRVFPVYWLILTGVIIIYVVLMNGATGHSNQVLKLDTSATWFYLLQNYTLFPIPNYVVGVAWSLAYEILFYLLFALCIYFGTKFTKIAIPAIVLSILCLSIGNVVFSQFLFTFISSPIILEFFVGCLIGYLFKYKSDQLQFSHFLLAFIIIVSSGILYYGILKHNFDRSSLVSIVIITAGSAFLILAAAVIDKIGKVKVPKPFILIGDASYAVYLIHPILLSMLCRGASIAILKFNLTPNLYFLFSIILIITVLSGIAFHLIIEKPLLKMMSLKRKEKYSLVNS